jgi:hypothetical protein
MMMLTISFFSLYQSVMAIDCQVSFWSNWSNCFNNGTGILQATRTRNIVTAPTNDCNPPDLAESIACTGSTACNDNDNAIWFQTGGNGGRDKYNEEAQSCGDCVKISLGLDPRCIERCSEILARGYSTSCISCFADVSECTVGNCVAECIFDSKSEECKQCVDDKCGPIFKACSGWDLPPAGFLCAFGQFQCGDSACIDGSQECNGTQDCTDNSDEMNCVLGATETGILTQTVTLEELNLLIQERELRIQTLELQILDLQQTQPQLFAQVQTALEQTLANNKQDLIALQDILLQATLQNQTQITINFTN